MDNLIPTNDIHNQAVGEYIAAGDDGKEYDASLATVDMGRSGARKFVFFAIPSYVKILGYKPAIVTE